MCFNQLILEHGLRLVAIKNCQETIIKDALKTHRAADENIKPNLAEPSKNKTWRWTDDHVDLSPLSSYI